MIRKYMVKGGVLRDSFLTAIKCSEKTMYPDYLSLSGEGYVPEMYKKYGELLVLWDVEHFYLLGMKEGEWSLLMKTINLFLLVDLI